MPVDADSTQAELVMQVRRLRKAFGGQSVLVDVDLDLRRGEVVLLRGDNGSGKTTLLNILTGYLEPDSGVIELSVAQASKRFAFCGNWLGRSTVRLRFSPEALASAGIGRTWQDTRLFGSQSLLQNIAVATPGQTGENPMLALVRRGLSKAKEREIVSQSLVRLEALGLGGREESSADMISLGQAKRVAIARALQGTAQVLFLDEPLAGLDYEGVQEVLEMLRAVVRDGGLTLVIVEHMLNMPFVLDLATTVWTLDGGEIQVERPEDVRNSMSCCSRGNMLDWISEHAGQTRSYVCHRLPGGGMLSVTCAPGSSPGDVLLRVEDLVVYRGSRLVVGRCKDGEVSGLSFSIRRGELGVLQAPNGWGKTSLIEAIAGLIPVQRGTIYLNGIDVTNYAPWERARTGLGILQARDNVFPGLSVREELSLSGVVGTPEGMRALISRRSSTLSGGERRKLAFECLRGRRIDMLVLDEPFSELDREGLDSIWNMFRSLDGSGTIVALPSGLMEEAK